MADGSALRQRGTWRGVPGAQQNWRCCGFDRLAKVHRRCCTNGYSLTAAQSQAEIIVAAAKAAQCAWVRSCRRAMSAMAPGLLGVPVPKCRPRTRPLV
jgi:hypothetical protein